MLEAGQATLNNIMQGGAMGCEIIISGKLKGERAKAIKFCDGYIFHSGQGIKDYVDKAIRHCKLRVGVFGIQVKILLPYDPTGKRGPKKMMPDIVMVLSPRKVDPLPLSFTYTRFIPLPPGWKPPNQVEKEESKKRTKTSKKKEKKNTKKGNTNR